MECDAGKNQQQADVVSYEVFTNDNSAKSNMALITLKNIFSKQLPKMPKEYIVRLCFDRRHYSLAILVNGKIIGGICYRPYKEQRFGEIAFCAINGSQQVRGFGTALMNQLKNHVQKEGLEYFLTYADNYAIGYFQKQGFSKQVVMPKDRWIGYIKDYDGGTLMECYIHPAMDYLSVKEVIAKQRDFIFSQLRQQSIANIEYSGCEIFKHGKRLHSVLEVPGVDEAGWNGSNINKGADVVGTERDRHMLHARMIASLKAALDQIVISKNAWPFKEAVNDAEAPGYAAMIMNPVDLSLISRRLRMNDYYRTRAMLFGDLKRMVNNCKQYNSDVESEYFEAADRLEKEIMVIFSDVDLHNVESDSAAAS